MNYVNVELDAYEIAEKVFSENSDLNKNFSFESIDSKSDNNDDDDDNKVDDKQENDVDEETKIISDLEHKTSTDIKDITMIF